MNISQNQLAQIIEVDSNTLRRWINGDIKRVKTINAQKIAEAIKVELSEILEDADISLEKKKLKTVDLGHENAVLIDLLAMDKWKNLDLFFTAFLSPILPIKTLASINSYLAFISLIKQSLDKLEVRSKLSMELAVKASNENLQGRSISLMAAHHFLNGRVEKGEMMMLEAIELVDTARDMSMITHFLSFFYLIIGRYEEAIHYSVVSKRASEQLKNTREKETMMTLYHSVMSMIYSYQGQIDKAERHHKDSFAHFKLAKTKRLAAILDVNLFYSEIRFNINIDKVDSVSKNLESLHNDFIYGFCLAEFATCCLELGKAATALSTIENYLSDTSRYYHIPLFNLLIYRKKYELHLALEQSDLADECLKIIESMEEEFGLVDKIKIPS